MRNTFLGGPVYRLLLSIILTCACPSWAGDTEEIRAALMVTGEATQADDPDVEITVDAGALDAEPIREDLDQMIRDSAEMRSPEYEKSWEDGIIIPMSVADEELLAGLAALAPEDLAVFLGRKAMFLEKIAKIFTFIRVKPKRINGWIHNLNKEFFKHDHPRNVAEGNTIVFSGSFGPAMGLATSDWLRKQTRKIPGLSWLPEKSGFYLMFNLGLSIYATKKGDKTKYGITPTFEFRRATRIFAPFAFVGGGIFATLSIEKFPSPASTRSKFYKFSAVSTVSSPEQFGLSSAVIGITLPPGGGAAAAMEGDAYRWRLTGQMFSKMYGKMKDYVTRKNNCDEDLR